MIQIQINIGIDSMTPEMTTVSTFLLCTVCMDHNRLDYLNFFCSLITRKLIIIIIITDMYLEDIM